MNREEALRRIKAWNLDSDDMEVLSVVIPELRESEDERIRKLLVWQVHRNIEDETNDLAQSVYDGIKGHDPDIEESIEDWKKCLAYLEKQKDASKAIEAVERIDKYIDAHTANAHDMNDSNPDKKYYQGQDDALGKIAGILQDVYSDEQQKEQKPAKWSEEDNIGWDEAFACVTRAEKAAKNEEELQNAVTAEKWLKEIKFKYCVHPQSKQEWSKEDDRMLTGIIERGSSQIPSHEPALREEQMEWLMNRLKSLRPQPKAEREPMEIKYGGKVYKVHGVRATPGGVTGYIIEDEPGHYDCIINPDEVLGGGYGIKQNGSPYPTKEATFDYPHWKPSEEQMRVFFKANPVNLMPEELATYHSLYNDFQKL